MKHLLTVVAAFLFVTNAHASPITIKFATLAPEGSTWTEVLNQANEEIKTKTSGKVGFRIYPGGIAGDEPDVLRKMKLGQYHAAGFTGVGLGEILPESRVFELPMYYRSVAELDFVKEKLTPEFEKKFLAQGEVFLGWAEPGLVYFFAQKPIHTLADMNGVKLWAWEADPLAAAMIHAFKVTPVNIALPDVLMALQTGMINAVYAPPMAAMALQWHTKVKYMIDEPLTNATGAVLVSKKVWDQIAPQDQVTVKTTIKAALDKLTASTRQQNQEAIEKFKQMGIQIVTPDAKGREEMAAAAAKIRPELVGKLYSGALLKQVEGLLTEFRTKSTKTSKK